MKSLVKILVCFTVMLSMITISSDHLFAQDLSALQRGKEPAMNVQGALLPAKRTKIVIKKELRDKGGTNVKRTYTIPADQEEMVKLEFADITKGGFLCVSKTRSFSNLSDGIRYFTLQIDENLSPGSVSTTEFGLGTGEYKIFENLRKNHCSPVFKHDPKQSLQQQKDTCRKYVADFSKMLNSSFNISTKHIFTTSEGFAFLEQPGADIPIYLFPTKNTPATYSTAKCYTGEELEYVRRQLNNWLMSRLKTMSDSLN